MTNKIGEIVSVTQDIVNTLFSGPLAGMWKILLGILVFFIGKAVLKKVLRNHKVVTVLYAPSNAIQKGMDKINMEGNAFHVVRKVLFYVGMLFVVILASRVAGVEIVSTVIGYVMAFIADLLKMLVFIPVGVAILGGGLASQDYFKKLITKYAPKIPTKKK